MFSVSPGLSIQENCFLLAWQGGSDHHIGYLWSDLSPAKSQETQDKSQKRGKEVQKEVSEDDHTLGWLSCHLSERNLQNSPFRSEDTEK